MVTRGIMLIAICAVAILFGFFLLVPSRWAYRPGTFAWTVIIRDHHGSPDTWVPDLIEREGGLPKAATHLTHYPDGVGIVNSSASPVYIHPVADWEIEQIRLSTPYGFLVAVLKGEAVYSIDIDFRASYVDGDTALLRWRTWRYGESFGPIAIDEGGGPAGEIELLLPSQS